MKVLIALLVSVLLFLSFKSMPVETRNQHTQQNTVMLYWYLLDNNGKVIQIFGYTGRSTIATGVCPDYGSIACARGYTTSLGLRIGDTAPTISQDLIRRLN